MAKIIHACIHKRELTSALGRNRIRPNLKIKPPTKKNDISAGGRYTVYNVWLDFLFLKIKGTLHLFDLAVKYFIPPWPQTFHIGRPFKKPNVFLLQTIPWARGPLGRPAPASGTRQLYSCISGTWANSLGGLF